MNILSSRMGALAIGIASLAILLSDIAQTAWFTAPPTPLLGASDWQETEGFFSDKLPVKPLEAPSEIAENSALQTWRSWEPKNGGHKGRLVSVPFSAPDYLAVPYTGFANENPDTFLRLECETTGEYTTLASGRTNNQWATIYLDTRDICPGQVQIVAQASSTGYYIGIGTPFSISRSTYLANTSYAPRLVVVFITILIFGSWSILATFRASPEDIARNLAWAFLVPGCLAMGVLACFMASRQLGIVMASFSALAGPVTLAFCWFSQTAYKERIREFLPLLTLWFAIAIPLTAILSAFDIGAGSWTANGIFSPLRWSTDNQLPILLSEALWNGTPPSDISWGPWLAADRPPLLSGMLLILRAPIGELGRLFGSSFISFGYEAAAVTLLASWVVAATAFFRLLGAGRVGLALLFVCASPFLLFNTVYVWPKALGASYAVIAFLLLRQTRIHDERSVQQLVLIACSAALSYLSHASNAFFLLPLALWYFRDLLKFGSAKILLASAAMGCVMLPWAIWTLALQPHGNALVRFALSADYGFDIRTQSIWASAYKTYHALSFSDWLSLKWVEISRIVGLGPEWSTYGEVSLNSPDRSILGIWRVQDFYSVGRALFFPLFVYCLAFTRRTRGHFDRAVILGIVSVALILFATFVPSYVHSTPYGALLLIIFAGGASLTFLPARAALAMTVAAWLYTMVVWVLPLFWIADRLHPSAFVALGLIPLLFVAQRRHTEKRE